MLNRVENIAHVAFVEFDGYPQGGGFNFAGTSDGTVYWYRDDYVACP